MLTVRFVEFLAALSAAHLKGDPLARTWAAGLLDGLFV